MFDHFTLGGRAAAALSAAAIGVGLLLGTVRADAADNESGGSVVSRCDNKRSLVLQGWCPDTGNKKDAARAERSRDRDVDTSNDSEPAGEPSGGSSPEIDRE